MTAPAIAEWTAELDAEFDALAERLRAALREYPGSDTGALAEIVGRRRDSGDVRNVLTEIAVQSGGRWRLR